MIYFIILFFVSVLYGIEYKNLSVSEYQSKKIRIKSTYSFICALLLIIIAGLRSVNVGADTIMYRTLFDYASQATSFKAGYNSWKSGGVEIGYYALEYFFAKHLNFQLFLFFAAFISIAPVMAVIYKYSVNYLYSIFLYIAFGYFSFAMNGLRQSIAIGICMIAYFFYRDKKLGFFLSTVFVAMLFHKSAILFLPVYFLGIIPRNKIVLIVFVILLGLFFVFRTKLFVILNRFSRQQFGASTNQGGFRMFLVMFSTAMIGWWVYRRFVKKKSIYDKKGNIGKQNWHLLLTISVAVLMWPIASVNAELNRMYYYYHIFIILFVPSATKALKSDERFIVNWAYCALSLFYLYAYIINGTLKYAPYIFYWQK